jgi:hypothetical protein
MPIIQVVGTIASSTETVTGKGLVKVWEKIDFRGQDKFVLWTAWFDRGQLHLGERDDVILEGRLSTKVGTWEKDGQEIKTVEHHLNDVVIKSHKSAILTNPLTPIQNDEVPF